MDEKKIGYQVEGSPHSYESAKPPKSYFDAVLRNLPIKKDSKVLDIASGAGNEAEFLRREYDAQVFEMDMASSAYEANHNQKRGFVLAKYDRLPYRNNTFSLIHCKDALIHFEDCNLFFREVSRVLTSGGYLIVTVPVVQPYSRTTPFLTVDYGTGISDSERRYFSGKYEEYKQIAKRLLKEKNEKLMTISPPYYPRAQVEIFISAKAHDFSVIRNLNSAVMWKPKPKENNWIDGDRSIMTFKKTN